MRCQAVRIEKTPEGDGNFNLNVIVDFFLIVRIEKTPEGDGNLDNVLPLQPYHYRKNRENSGRRRKQGCYSIHQFHLLVRIEKTPEGDGNSAGLNLSAMCSG